MRRGALDRQRDLAQQQPRPDRAGGGQQQDPERRRAEHRRDGRAVRAAGREHDRVDPHEHQHGPAAEPMRRLEPVVVLAAEARAGHEHDHEDQARHDRRDHHDREVDAALAVGVAVDHHRDEREVPDRPGEREPHVQPTEVVVLAERPAHPDRPRHRRPRREPAEEVDHVLLAEDDRQRDVRLSDHRDRPERRREGLPVADAVDGEQRVRGEDEHDQPVVVHRPRRLQQPPQPPRPLRQRDPVGAMLRRHVAFADDLSEIVSGRLRRVHERLELGAVEAQNADLADGPHRCRPRPRREQPDLAEVLAGLHRPHVHVAVRGGLGPLDLPGLDDVEAVGRIALAHDHVAAPEPRLIQVHRPSRRAATAGGAGAPRRDRGCAATSSWRGGA